MDNRYMLITVIDREILTEQFDSYEEARKQMLSEFCYAADVDPEDCTELESECDGEFGYAEWNAYVSDGPNHEDYDWLIVSIGDTVDSNEKSIPVGRIEFLGFNGEVVETVEYSNSKKFEQDIKDENHYGVPMSVVVYRNADGSTIPHDFVFDCDPPLKGFRIEDRKGEK